MTWRGRFHRTARRGEGSARGERGETLIELLITIALMGIAFAAVTTAFFAASSGAAQAQERTRVSVALQAWAEGVLGPKNSSGNDAYESCVRPDVNPPRVRSSSGYVQWGSATESGTTATWTNSMGWTATMTTTYMAVPSNPADSSFWNSPTFGASCSKVAQGGIDRDARLQRVVLHIKTKSTGGTSDGLVLYRRDARCPTTSVYNNPDQGPC